MRFRNVPTLLAMMDAMKLQNIGLGNQIMLGREERRGRARLTWACKTNLGVQD